MNAQMSMQSVSYYAITDAQLKKIIAEGVKETLKEIGFNFNNGIVSDKNDEAMPVEYWVNKLGVDRATLWRRQKAGVLNPTYMGRKLFYRPSDIDLMFQKLNDGKQNLH